MKKLGAVFGQKFGWKGQVSALMEKQEDDWPFRRSNWFKSVERMQER